MKHRKFVGSLLLMLAALIWGTAFVAQRLGMDHIGPFAFNGIRFILGGLCLLPLEGRTLPGSAGIDCHRCP